jgi:hypothetical protein
VDAIIWAMGFEINLLKLQVDSREVPPDSRFDALIAKAKRLQSALEGCKVETSELPVSHS